MSETPWEGRRKHEPTATYLARVLREYLGLEEMAGRAELGHFDDYFCPTEIDDGMNMHRLVAELRDAGGPRSNREQRAKIKHVVEAVIAGEFDGTNEESDRWAQSKTGQDTMRELPPEMRRALFGDDPVTT